MFIQREQAVGVVDGVNKVFTTSQNIFQIDQINVDGIDYLGSITTLGNQITLGDAPQYYVYVWYWTSAPPPPNSTNNPTLADYLMLLTQKLAQSNMGFHTLPDRIAAINEAILKIADNYEVPELRKKPYPNGTITFTNGESVIPGDFLRMIKLWTPSVQAPFGEYTYLVNDLFDDQPQNSGSYFWTMDWDPVQQQLEFFIVPNSVSSPSVLNMRYLMVPTILVNQTDVSSLSFQWNYAVAYKAASILFNNEHNPAGAVMELNADKEVQKAYEGISKQGGVKQGERLRSRFEKYPLLNSPQV